MIFSLKKESKQVLIESWVKLVNCGFTYHVNFYIVIKLGFDHDLNHEFNELI